MRLKLLSTSVFRLSLVYALAFSLIASAAIGLIYWWVADQIQQQTDERLQLETRLLLDQYRESQLDVLFQLVERKNIDRDPSLYIYAVIPKRQRDLSLGFEADYVSSDGKFAYATMPLGQVVEEAKKGERQDDPVRVLLTVLPGGYQLLVGQDLLDQQQLLNRIMWMVIWAIVITVLLAISGGLLMGYDVLRRIDAVRKTAGEIVDGDLSQRLPVTSRDDEFDRLSRVVNQMLQKLQLLMTGMREVSDNLAHDLRNPLNRLRNRIEVTLMEPRNEAEYRDVLGSTLEDADGLISTFNALLSIARAESGVRREDWETVNITALVDELGELYQAVAEESDVSFHLRADPALAVQGNRQLLAQVITNLLDNAVKFTPRGGQVWLDARRSQQRVVIEVRDTGPGIPEADRQRVFERFTRLDSSRSTCGSGLGLSLVKAVLKLHDADITLLDNHPGLKAQMSFHQSPAGMTSGKELQEPPARRRNLLTATKRH